MIDVNNLLTVVGLSIDVVGAVVIAVPDIPQISQYHKAGRMDTHLRNLQDGATAATGKGFRELRDFLVDGYNEPIPDNIRALRVQPGTSDNRFDNLILGLDHRWRNVYIVPDDEEPYIWIVTPFPRIRRRVRHYIRRRESYMRSFGFVVLSLGFLLQMIGTVYP